MNRLKSLGKNLLRFIAFLSIGIFLIFLALRNIDLTQLWNDIANARFSYVLISMILGYLAFMSRGIRWNYLLEPMGYKVPVWKAIHSISIGYLANAAMPRAGEIIRCTVLHQASKIPVNRLVGTVVAERVIDMMMLGLSLMLSLLFNVNKLRAFYAKTLKSNPPESTAGHFSNGWYYLLSFVAFVFVLMILKKHWINLPFVNKIRGLWSGFKEGILSVVSTPKRIPFILHTLFIWMCYYLMVHIVIYALPGTVHLSPVDSLFLMIVAGLGMLVPSPAGIGSYHYAVVTGMGILGVSPDTGMAFATLVHSGQFVMTLVAGFISLIGMYAFRGSKALLSESELKG
ncbi:lysylphosphatidylglycerol synthase transmembrane domain-containing protein [Schleiferia thermophila]|uniref:lysylphosphatidylglycerol synthase transmembrane domain-containing protein n=1 Tax=Schleiferia thermophila TaxID=884107 RepID=UPI00136480FA|nr:lysylphosphatidylglycerol synthase transmembrane domain-containing protein [Schleiferia thermophila]